MAKRINIDIGKAVKVFRGFLSNAFKAIKPHKETILTVISISAIVNNIKTHFEKKSIEKAYQEDSIKYKSITQKHEAEIQALKEQAEKSAQAEVFISWLRRALWSRASCEKISRPPSW